MQSRDENAGFTIKDPMLDNSRSSRGSNRQTTSFCYCTGFRTSASSSLPCPNCHGSPTFSPSAEANAAPNVSTSTSMTGPQYDDLSVDASFFQHWNHAAAATNESGASISTQPSPRRTAKPSRPFAAPLIPPYAPVIAYAIRNPKK